VNVEVIKSDKHHHPNSITINHNNSQKKMKLYVAKNGIILALSTASWPVVVKGDNTLTCPDGSNVVVDYCGGNPKTSAVKELSCTPFPLKSESLPPYVHPGDLHFVIREEN
jgi:hypothetical protein